MAEFEVKGIVILGAGGHARVLIAVLALTGQRPSGCIAPKRPAPDWPAGIPWLGDDENLKALSTADVHLVNGVGGIRSDGRRAAVFNVANSLGFSFMSVTHPTAIIADGVAIGGGAQIMAGTVVQTGSTIGRNTIINSGAVIDHDAVIGDHCHIATGAALSGHVTLGTGVHIGTGAAIIQGIAIADNATVGAGAVVIRDVGAGQTVAGNPARVIGHRVAAAMAKGA